MKEKIKIICLIFITIGFLIISLSIGTWGIIYGNAYRKCVKNLSHMGGNEIFMCVGVLNGRSSQ